MSLYEKPEYMSYSGISTYQQCPEQYRLTRLVKGLPRQEAVWFVAGSAFHWATEQIDRDDSLLRADDTTLTGLAHEAMNKELAKLDCSLSTLAVGGRKTKQWPQGETLEFWHDAMPRLVIGYKDWRVRDGWRPYLIDDETPAIELPIEYEVHGMPVKGYLDNLFITPNGELVLLDKKTGSRVPDSTLQLEIYRQGLRTQYDVWVDYGAYYMARKGQVDGFTQLGSYGELLEDAVTDTVKGIENDLFTPHPSNLCGTCSVREWCRLKGTDPISLPTL